MTIPDKMLIEMTYRKVLSDLGEKNAPFHLEQFAGTGDDIQKQMYADIDDLNAKMLAFVTSLGPAFGDVDLCETKIDLTTNIREVLGQFYTAKEAGLLVEEFVASAEPVLNNIANSGFTYILAVDRPFFEEYYNTRYGEHRVKCSQVEKEGHELHELFLALNHRNSPIPCALAPCPDNLPKDTNGEMTFCSCGCPVNNNSDDDF